jgi:hypothetical protein
LSKHTIYRYWGDRSSRLTLFFSESRVGCVGNIGNTAFLARLLHLLPRANRPKIRA